MTKQTSPSAAGTANADRIELIQTFVRIVQSGSLSAAAVHLGTTQPTISRRLQQLERSLGVRLLHRSTHAMKLTKDGERCFERAKELLEGWDAFESDMRGSAAEASGLLRVVVPHVFGQRQLIGPLALFMRRHPRMTVDWLLNERATDFVAQGIDCAIQVGEVTDPSLVVIHLAEVPRKLVAAPALLAEYAEPTQPRDLTALPWLAIPHFYWHQVRLRHIKSGKTCEVPIQPRLTSDNFHALTNAAIEGLGVALISAWIVKEHLDNGRLVELLPDWQAATLPVSVVYPYAPLYSARLRLFVELMREVMPAAVRTETRQPARPRGRLAALAKPQQEADE